MATWEEIFTSNSPSGVGRVINVVAGAAAIGSDASPYTSNSPSGTGRAINVNIVSGGAGAGVLQLQNNAPLDTTLRSVTDQAGTVSPLSLSTTQFGVTQLFRQYAQSGSGNISQNINNNIGYNRADGTTSDTMDYGACRYVTMSTYGPFMNGFTEKTRLDLNGKFGIKKTPSTYLDSDGPARLTRGLDI